jgi:hypothetical protein
LRAIQGRYSEGALHGLTLLCHILAAWFLYLLLRRLTGNYWGVVATILSSPILQLPGHVRRAHSLPSIDDRRIVTRAFAVSRRENAERGTRNAE